MTTKYLIKYRTQHLLKIDNFLSLELLIKYLIFNLLKKTKILIIQ